MNDRVTKKLGFLFLLLILVVFTMVQNGGAQPLYRQKAINMPDGSIFPIGLKLSDDGAVVGYPWVDGQRRIAIWKEKEILTNLALPAGAQDCTAGSINHIGQAGYVLGLSCYFGAAGYKGYSWTSAGYSELPTYWSGVAYPRDVNSAGVIAGVVVSSGPIYHPAVWQGAEMLPLLVGCPGNFQVEAISNNLIGGRKLGSGPSGCVYNLERQTTNCYVGPAGETMTVVKDVNAGGVAVGYFTSDSFGNEQFPVVWTNGMPLSIPLIPNAFDGWAWSINDQGAVVGHQGVLEGTPRGFIFVNGQVRDLNQLLVNPDESVIERAWAINNQGLILAGTDFYGPRLLVPVKSLPIDQMPVAKPSTR